jgi:hypothetical protein
MHFSLALAPLSRQQPRYSRAMATYFCMASVTPLILPLNANGAL